MNLVIKSSYKNSYCIPEPLLQDAIDGVITSIEVQTIDGSRTKKVLKDAELLESLRSAEIKARKGWHQNKRATFYVCYFY